MTDNLVDTFTEFLKRQEEKNKEFYKLLIRVKYYDGIPEFEQTEIGSWIDCYTAEDTFIKKGEFKYIPLGFALELPVGYEAVLAPRSSTFKKWGIIQANSIGIIDNSYCGDNDQWMMPAIEMVGDIYIPKGTRLCQFRIQEEQPNIMFFPVDSLDNRDRGGFGSTGV